MRRRRWYELCSATALRESPARLPSSKQPDALTPFMLWSRMMAILRTDLSMMPLRWPKMVTPSPVRLVRQASAQGAQTPLPFCAGLASKARPFRQPRVYHVTGRTSDFSAHVHTTSLTVMTGRTGELFEVVSLGGHDKVTLPHIFRCSHPTSSSHLAACRPHSTEEGTRL